MALRNSEHPRDLAPVPSAGLQGLHLGPEAADLAIWHIDPRPGKEMANPLAEVFPKCLNHSLTRLAPGMEPARKLQLLPAEMLHQTERRAKTERFGNVDQRLGQIIHPAGQMLFHCARSWADMPRFSIALSAVITGLACSFDSRSGSTATVSWPCAMTRLQKARSASRDEFSMTPSR